MFIGFSMYKPSMLGYPQLINGKFRILKYKIIFCWDIPLHRPEKWALYMVGTSNLGSWNSHWVMVNPIELAGESHMKLPDFPPCTRPLHGWASACSALQWCGAACGTPQWCCGCHGKMGISWYHGLLMGIYRNSAKIWPLETVDSFGLGKSSVETMALPQHNYTFLQIFIFNQGWEMVSWSKMTWSVEMGI